ncbi:hypothetical protein Kpol_1039p13 [Vanderwaltozyma polyspora DSM 70294]|uniref:Regulator of rDNA transcription 14 n=1 Tax=Vanderwaltozyma polyspora (strain ATCC 22028 / DSM 70294 / BCRC 21397 / CBS 2163 / NBRC 10782 / NRRL Y-8283 / UCD 57-17) TaxID=436907 RepID=RRT14_VANPO|nr:uncharacterized protein Kpol_1039p13 [Vanderwaltozyma polyspora DSM 70294]A7THE0.1 RecName: Full=Regulator of rDNA transcription 14 [Vanderwaltozyma polyspora DSM 70294]EDO18264.1 hypothetical protein Kpol_1039p13 [Vanderwaltozyma polyspora DSM 70294]
MSSTGKATELQATMAVNSLLSNILPGANKMRKSNDNNNNKKNSKGTSKAQLIDRNLKRNLEIMDLDTHKFTKKNKIKKNKKIKKNVIKQNELKEIADLEIFKKHKIENNLTLSEKKKLNKIISKNLNKIKSRELDSDDQEELDDVQKFILDQTSNSQSYNKSKKRKTRRKEFKEFKNPDKNSSMDHRYPGLTPGLAPVGLSDEEDSSDEDDDRNDY